MSNRERHRAGQEARRQVSTKPAGSGQADQLNRYLSAALHHEVMQAATPAAQAEPATPATARPQPIVVGFDGSEASREALRWAVSEAEMRGCRVRAVTIAPVITQRSVAAPPLPEDLDDAALVDPIHSNGALPGALIDESIGAQLLVLGTRGHGRVLDAALGSVSRQCIRDAHCPVVVIPAGLLTHPG